MHVGYYMYMYFSIKIYKICELNLPRHCEFGHICACKGEWEIFLPAFARILALGKFQRGGGGGERLQPPLPALYTYMFRVTIKCM